MALNAKLFDYQLDLLMETIESLRDRSVKVGPVEATIMEYAASGLEVGFEDEIAEYKKRLAAEAEERSKTELQRATERYFRSRIEDGIQEGVERWIEREESCRGSSSYHD